MSTYPTLTERKAWSYAVADKRITNRRLKADSLELVQLLRDVVLQGERRKLRIDPLTKWWAGPDTDNLENSPAVIEHFCQWLWICMHANKTIAAVVANDNTEKYKKTIPALLDFADELHFNKKEISSYVTHQDSAFRDAVKSLARFMKRKTGNNRFYRMAKLLNKTAIALNANQTYHRDSLRKIVQPSRPKQRPED